MKKLSLVIAALAMMLGITQCKKQENPVGGKLITQEVTFTTSFGDGSKLDQEGIVADGGNLSLRWEVGDEIKVTDNATPPNESKLTCTSVSPDGLTGTFKGTITCIENATLTFGAGTKPDYTDQHVTDIKKAVYLECSHEYVQSGDYELELAMPYAILKVDLSDLAPVSGSNDVSVKINDETDPAAKVTGVKTDDCQVYLLLPLTAAGQTTLTFTNGTKSITKTYPLAANGFYTGGGNGGFAPVDPEPVEPEPVEPEPVEPEPVEPEPVVGGEITDFSINEDYETSENLEFNFTIKPNAECVVSGVTLYLSLSNEFPDIDNNDLSIDYNGLSYETSSISISKNDIKSHDYQSGQTIYIRLCAIIQDSGGFSTVYVYSDVINASFEFGEE